MELGFRKLASPIHGSVRGAAPALPALSALIALLAAGPAAAQAPLRCDLQLESTPGASAGSACLDLVAMHNGGSPIVTANNATRISIDGFKLCKNAFEVTKPAGADIVFIYDNSGSMWPGYVKVNAATSDTTFYHISGCGGGGGGGGGGGVTGTPFAYTTLMGPYSVQLVDAAVNCQANGLAGDPYFARGKVIEKAIDYLVQNSPTSTAGAMAFANTTGNLRPPLQLSVPGNPDSVKRSISLDSIRNTNYVPALTQARAWLTDSAYMKNSKQAIVFISDGEPTDANALTTWLRNNDNKSIPIYTIALGDSGVTFARMREISDATGGAFYRVPPENTALMNEVMQKIIQAITIPTIPRSIEVANGAFTPPMVSRSTGMNRNPDSSISPVMDSILALKQGLNTLNVKVTMSDNEIRNYTVKVQADGPIAATNSETLNCYPMPTLTLLNQAGGTDTAYTAATVPYNVRLTRATSDLQQVVVVATSKDTSRAGWGDEERIALAQASASGGTTVNLKNNYPVNGSAANAAKGNNTLEAAPGPGGSITLTWSHPRDARETATFTMPGKIVATTDGFIDVVRASDAPHGVPLPPAVVDPVVIRGGVVLTRNNSGAVITHKGDLSNPHNLDDNVLDPNHTPTFVFNTAAPFAYNISIYDHTGQFLNSKQGAVDSARWEQMRGNADSLACSFTILPVAKNGQRFGTGVYILRATLTTKQTNRKDQGKPLRVTPATRLITNRFGYVR